MKIETKIERAVSRIVTEYENEWKNIKHTTSLGFACKNLIFYSFPFIITYFEITEPKTFGHTMLVLLAIFQLPLTIVSFVTFYFGVMYHIFKHRSNQTRITEYT